MFLQILTVYNSYLYSSNLSYSILKFPFLVRGLMRIVHDSVDLEYSLYLVNRKNIPFDDTIFRSNIAKEFIEKKIRKSIGRSLKDRTVTFMDYELIVTIPLVGINIVSDGEEVKFINSSGFVLQGVITEQKFIKSGNVVFPLTNVIII